jgi:hypothetical protein
MEKWLLLSFGFLAVETNFLKMWRFSLMWRLRVSIETTSRQIETWKMDAIKLWCLENQDQLFENVKIFWLSRPPFWNYLDRESRWRPRLGKLRPEKWLLLSFGGLNSWDQIFENMEIFLTVEIKSLDEDHVEANWDLKNGWY